MGGEGFFLLNPEQEGFDAIFEIVAREMGHQWLRRIRAAVTTGLLWALPWAIVAVLIRWVVDPDESMDEIRRLDELSVRRFGAWGAVAGLVIGVLPFVLGTPRADIDVARLAAVVAGSFTLMSAASAAGSLALARRGEGRERLDAGADSGDARLGDGE